MAKMCLCGRQLDIIGNICSVCVPKKEEQEQPVAVTDDDGNELDDTELYLAEFEPERKSGLIRGFGERYERRPRSRRGWWK